MTDVPVQSVPLTYILLNAASTWGLTGGEYFGVCNVIYSRSAHSALTFPQFSFSPLTSSLLPLHTLYSLAALLDVWQVAFVRFNGLQHSIWTRLRATVDKRTTTSRGREEA